MGETALVRQAVCFIISDDMNMRRDFDKLDRTMVRSECFQLDFPERYIRNRAFAPYPTS